MSVKLRSITPGFVVAGLLALLSYAPLSCATTTEMPESGPPPQKDAGVKETAPPPMEAGKCGKVGQACCLPPSQCEFGAFCNSALNECKEQHPKDIGKPCSSPSSCSSGICGYTQGISDGAAPVPDGNGTPPPQPTGCTVGCFNTTPDCMPGWTCQQLEVGEGVCICNWAPEACDGLDNNCDGIVDNRPETDNWCTQMMGGIPQVCKKGSCECVNTCNGGCVDIQSDDQNCGKCNHKCKAMVEKCSDGECTCAYDICNKTDCVNTHGSDNANCGACGKKCDYQCSSGICGPEVVASSLNSPGSVVTDSSNVYWVDYGTSFILSIQYCPLAGCATPSSPNTLATALEGYPNGLGQLAIAGSRAYVADNYSFVETCATGGCGGTASTYASSTGTTHVAADSSNLYWSSSTGIFSCPLGASCATPTTIATTPSAPAAITVSGGKVYWAVGTYSYGILTIYSAPVGGGVTNTVCTTSLSATGGMVVSGSRLYITGYYYSNIYTCPLPGTGAAASLYYSDFNEPFGIATDGKDLFWTDDGFGSGSVQKCALGATCASATAIASGLTGPTGIAVQGGDVYWAQNGSPSSSIMRFHN